MSRDQGVVLVWEWQQLCFMTLALQGFRKFLMLRPRRIWAYESISLDSSIKNLLGSFDARKFKGQMCMDVSAFEYLYSILALFMPRQDMNMRLVVPIHVRVAVSISTLVTADSVQSNTDLKKQNWSFYKSSCGLLLEWRCEICFAQETHQIAFR
ncbi:hypothetical protein KC19_VG233600 [Ceratodon purpureus]|uniref:Uncharacterized protein n=1 Tax=Ceratodon purpureus TaxID=3225 RepID=A0A8T0HTN4_CERPU|nr:hypothetical protein KC19_VG233600 [Ceratodon purpureus]